MSAAGGWWPDAIGERQSGANASSLRRVREQSLKNQRSLIGTKSRVRMPV